MKHATFRYSHWIGLANAFDAELIPRALTRETTARGVTAEFLRCIGITSSQFGNAEARRNETVGPFTVNVAREALRSIAKTGEPLKWLQATRCKKKLAAYLEEKGWADGGYCGLSTALARQIEAEFRPHNDAFAEAVWGRPWAEIFTADVTEEFTPNDFSISPPSWLNARRLREAIREIKETMREILADPALAVEAPWNDVMLRGGFVSP